jgi:hypothetical protein
MIIMQKNCIFFSTKPFNDLNHTKEIVKLSLLNIAKKNTAIDQSINAISP